MPLTRAGDDGGLAGDAAIRQAVHRKAVARKVVGGTTWKRGIVRIVLPQRPCRTNARSPSAPATPAGTAPARSPPAPPGAPAPPRPRLQAAPTRPTPMKPRRLRPTRAPSAQSRTAAGRAQSLPPETCRLRTRAMPQPTSSYENLCFSFSAQAEESRDRARASRAPCAACAPLKRPWVLSHSAPAGLDRGNSAKQCAARGCVGGRRCGGGRRSKNQKETSQLCTRHIFATQGARACLSVCLSLCCCARSGTHFRCGGGGRSLARGRGRKWRRRWTPAGWSRRPRPLRELRGAVGGGDCACYSASAWQQRGANF